MVLQAGAVRLPVRPAGYIRLKLNRINVFVSCSLLIAGTMLCHTSIIYKFNVALFIHKITNNVTNVPTILKGTLTLASEVHSYNTRFVSNPNFYRPRIRNNYGAATFAFDGSKIWEKIPSKLKKKTSRIITSTRNTTRQTVPFKYVYPMDRVIWFLCPHYQLSFLLFFYIKL